MEKRRLFAMGVVLSLLFLISPPSYSQVGFGPYTPDENTVVLMHFEGDLTDASGKTAGGTGHGTYQFIPGLPNLGQCLYLKNDAQTDSSFITVPDTSYLDITGPFTVECWVYILTFGQGPADWRWAPRMFAKAGDDAFYFPNYWLMAWGDTQKFSAGYYAGNYVWVDRQTPDGFIELNKWYHFAFIYDPTSDPHRAVTLIHDEYGSLLFMDVYTLNPVTEEPPITTNQPLFVGYGGYGSTDSWLDGFVDEIRISNTVRVFPLPPIITNTTQLPNTTDTIGPYTVQANVTDESKVDSAKLVYNVGADWIETDMPNVGDDLYQGSIPGQPAGTIVKYYVKAVDDSGDVSTDPRNAPEDYYSFAVVLGKALTLYYAFEEGSGAPQDSSVSGLAGTVHGGVTYSTDAKFGNYSMAFSSADSGYIEIPDTPVLDLEKFTVELWFKANQLVNNLRLISKQGGVDYAWYQPNYEIKTTAAGVIEVGSYLQPGGWNNFQGDSVLTTGQWYHLAYVFDGGYASLYVLDSEDNLIERKTMPQSGTPIFTKGPLVIGHAGPDVEPYYDGLLDNVKIYNYARSFGEITQGGPYHPDENTVLLLHFEGNYDDASGTVPAGTPSNANVGFATSLPGFGQALHLTNSSASDSARVLFADDPALDITGPFSMEAWFNIQSKGESWQTDPRILAKPGDPWWTPNYWMQVAGGNEFSAGYYTGDWIWIDRRDDGSHFQLNKWYHMYFYYNGSDSVHSVVRDSLWNVVWEDHFELAEKRPPIPTDFPLNIGFGGGGNDSWFDGYIDEVRIQKFAVTGVESKPTVTNFPAEYRLSQNYPNPFNPETKIEYSLPKNGRVTIKIYNLLGQEVRTLVNEVKDAGNYVVRWNGKDNLGKVVGSGVYFYRLKSGDIVKTNKMVLMR